MERLRCISFSCSNCDWGTWIYISLQFNLWVAVAGSGVGMFLGLGDQGIVASRNFSDYTEFSVNRYNCFLHAWLLCMLCKHATHTKSLGGLEHPPENFWKWHALRLILVAVLQENLPLNTCMIIATLIKISKICT